MSTKKHIPLLLDEPVITVYPSLAKALGNINKAVILQQVHFLLNVAKQSDNQYNFVDDRWWVYNTYEQWHEKYFTWLSVSTIKGLFLALEEDGLISSVQGVKNKLDRRKWYTINYAKFEEIVQCMGQKLSDEETKTIPSEGQELSDVNRNTENTTETPIIDAGKPREDKPVPAVKMNPMKNAIAIAFNWKWESMSKIEKGLVQKAAKELCEVGVLPDEVQALYAYCKKRFDNFKPMALVGNVSDWRKTRPNKLIRDDGYIPVQERKSVLDGVELA